MRRDAGQWAYGFDISDRDNFTIFRANEEDINFNSGMFGNAFVEYRPGPRTTVTFNVNNLFATKGIRDRVFTFPNRSFDGPHQREFRERNNHQTFQLTFKRNFGGGAGQESAAAAGN